MSNPFNFSDRFTQLSGIAHEVDSEAAAADTIASILIENKTSCVALAGLSHTLTEAIEARCPEITVLKEPYAADTLPGAIDTADVGITGIAFAIAQSGTLVELAANDAVRLVSALPRTYIGIVRKADILDQFDEAAAAVRKAIANHDRNLVISFISGPSRTGDIEMKLTLGVHGPEVAHAVIVDDG